MCTKVCLAFGRNNLKEEDVSNKDILEVGSYNVNGSIKGHVMSLNPKKYIGIDMRDGPNVDIVCNVDDLTNRFGKESFDIVISMETLEHVEHWQTAISNLKNVCRPNGKILITTVSKGWGKHDFPFDYWRYEASDMEQMFADCIIEKIECNQQNHTIFVMVKKPENFVEKDLSLHQLYRIT